MPFDILQGFLDAEIAHATQEMYNSILYFLKSFEIREGKFEANIYLLHKINRDTVIIYQEYELPNGREYSQEARIFNIKDLLSKIDAVVLEIGLLAGSAES